MRKPLTSKILFVDDESSILEGFKLTIGRKYDITTADSGESALKACEEHGPFAVIVSDFAMPSMNGAEFLAEVRKLDEDVVTMLLTGQANFEEVSRTVSSGGIFRLLGKPCSSDKLIENIEQALKQYRLVRAEKELLEGTLYGSVGALISLFSASKPLFFGRAHRVRRIVVKLADILDLKDSWRMEMATIFSYLGYLTLPDSELEKIYKQEKISPEVEMIIAGFPAFINDLLLKIPRMSKVAKIVQLLGEKEAELTPVSEDEHNIILSVAIIRMAMDFERMRSEGIPQGKIIGELEESNLYDLEHTSALREIIQNNQDEMEKLRVSSDELKEGMVLEEDLRLSNGTLFAPKGTEVTYHLMRTIDNYVISHLGNPFPDKIDVVYPRLSS